MSYKITEHYACDFECTTVEPFTVYMATIKNINSDEEPILFNDIGSFMNYVKDKNNVALYFHNGKNYDFNFIEYYIRKYNPSNSRTPNNFSYNERKLHTIEYTTNEVELTEKRKEAKTHNGSPVYKSNKIYLVDTTDVFKMSLAELAKVIGLEKGKVDHKAEYGDVSGIVETPLVVDFGVSPTGKPFWTEQYGEQYNPSYITHLSDFRNDCEIKGWNAYAKLDTEILARVIKEFKLDKHVESGNTTIASIAFKEMLNRRKSYKKLLQQKLSEYKEMDKEHKEAMRIELKSMRDAYKGGISWTNPKHANKLLRNVNGYYLDYTSMYPSIYMNPDKYPLPNRLAKRNRFNTEIDPNGLYIVKLYGLHAKVKEGRFPLLKQRTDVTGKKGTVDNSIGYFDEFIGDITLTKPEYEYYLENYVGLSCDKALFYQYTENYSLEMALKEHGEYWFDKKNNSHNEAERLYAKMMLNSVYGYLGFYDKDINQYETEYTDNGIQKNLIGKHKTGLQLPEITAAAFITAYGRVKLANDINKYGIDNVVCCDTDSLLLINQTEEPKTSNELGEFKLEHTFDSIISIRPKTYCIAENDKIVKQGLAGGNYKFEHIEEFYAGNTYMSKQKVRGVGGVGIETVEKTLGVSG